MTKKTEHDSFFGCKGKFIKKKKNILDLLIFPTFHTHKMGKQNNPKVHNTNNNSLKEKKKGKKKP